MKIANKKAVIINDTSYELHHGCHVVMNNLSLLLKKNKFEILSLFPVNKDWRECRNLKRHVDKADIVIVNGEGSLHHATPAANRLAAIAPYCKKRSIPVVLLNTTYQENGYEIADFMKSFDLIFVREKRSYEELEKYGVFSRIVPDLTFYSSYLCDYGDRREIIGYTDSVYQDLSLDLCSKFNLEQYQFLPMVCRPYLDKRKRIKSLLRLLHFKQAEICLALKRKLNMPFSYQDKLIENSVLNDYLYKKNLLSLKCIIAARYHALCFALQLRIPFLAIDSNSHKINGLLEDVKISKRRIVNAIDEIDDKIAENLNFTHVEMQHIDHYVETARDKIDEMFNKINGLLL